MAVIVTGATSFIGRAVVEELLKQGQKVYAVARPGSAGLSFLKALPLNGQEGRREGAVGSIRILECNLNEIERLKEMDITDAAAVDRVMKQVSPDAVIHCAAYTAGSGSSGEKHRLCAFGCQNSRSPWLQPVPFFRLSGGVRDLRFSHEGGSALPSGI